MPELKKRIDFAISYAGEDLAHVREVSTRLRQLGFNVFLAAEHRALLVGVDGEHFFDQLFSNASQVLVFISENYKRKEWPRYEWDVIRARDNLKRFIPIRIDDALILGLPSNILYLDVRNASYDEIAKAAIQQLVLYEQDRGIHRPSEFELILDAIRSDNKGTLAKAYQLVVDERERSPLNDVEVPTAEWSPSYKIVETEWYDFSKVRRLSGRICVPEHLGRDELTFNLKHCAASLFNELKPDALMLFAHSGFERRSGDWGVYDAGRIIFAPHGKWEGAMDGVAYNLPSGEFEYKIDFASAALAESFEEPTQGAPTDNNLLSRSLVGYAARLRSRFPGGISFHGVMYPGEEMPCLPQDITRFEIDAGIRDMGLGPAFAIEGTLKLGALPPHFQVFDGAKGRRYMLFLQGYLLSPSGEIVWQQHGFPRGGAWVGATGEETRFILIQKYDGSTEGHSALILAAGDPILSEHHQTRVLLGMKEIILD